MVVNHAVAFFTIDAVVVSFGLTSVMKMHMKIMYIQKMNIVSRALAVLTIVGLLASCGGGGGGGASASSGSTTTTINGVALDGYLYNASVFLDLNGNGQFDAGEPSGTTNSNGGYTLNATQDQLNSHSVIVLAQAGVTVDQDNPNTPINSAMTLIAPVGAPTVVSPITTHVAAKMATGLTLDQAKAATQTELGISASEVLSDFISTSGSGSDAHKVATAIAEVLKSVESSSNNSTSVAAKLSAVSTQVSSKVVNNLSAIKQASSADEAKQIFQNVNQASNIYSIGGSISGLGASGLVLTNGLGTVRPSSSATTFTFPFKQAANTSYSVSVSSNPEGHTCTVSNASGNVTSNSITNVAVSCQQTPGQLSGTVSGLTTSGLKLTNGSEEISISNGSSTFAFNTRIAVGEGYSVSVSGQPTGKTCTVANASGSMASNGVNNLQVTCANRAYTLGGSISGLTTSGLKLKNGSETIDVSSSATTYIFSTSVAYGSSYQVEVARQPTGQTCSISSGTGTMGSANVSAANVSCSSNTYFIGGRISGVTSNGLKVKLGSETLNISSNATSYQFTEKAAYGSSYAVSIEAPPTGYQCSISNKVGTTPAYDISNIDVACAPYQPKIFQIVKGNGLPSSTPLIYNYSTQTYLQSFQNYLSGPVEVKVGDELIMWVESGTAWFYFSVLSDQGELWASQSQAGTVISQDIVTYLGSPGVGFENNFTPLLPTFAEKITIKKPGLYTLSFGSTNNLATVQIRSIYP